MLPMHGKNTADAVSRLPLWTWIVAGLFCHLGTQVSLHFEFVPGVSILHPPIPLGVAKIVRYRPSPSLSQDTTEARRCRRGFHQRAHFQAAVRQTTIQSDETLAGFGGMMMERTIVTVNTATVTNKANETEIL
jgi:hypothetical protein